MTKLIVLVLKLDGDPEHGVPVTLTMVEEDNRLSTEVTGYLPPNLMLATKSERWQRDYRSLGQHTRIKDLEASMDVEIISTDQWCQNCKRSGEDLLCDFNQWLRSESFRPIRDVCLQQFTLCNEVRLLIRTASQSLLKLPWREWDLVENNQQVEVAFCAPDSHRKTKAKEPTLREKVKILAILGNSKGIKLQQDQQVLKDLPDAVPTFLNEPERRLLNDSLWQQSWDILFFAGHSKTVGERGQIDINQTDSLTIAELKYALRNAVDNGLQVAIFNSCDGMGLALELQDLHIPLLVVMREPVPDLVAQAFLTYFLPAFASGESFYLAARKARERLQGLENEYPCASWLPIIFQNPATASPTWQELGRRPTDKCPYRGLFAFQESDAPFFFGRESFAQTLVEAVQRQPLVAVIGNSGSGKSSVVKAGLIPHLRQQGAWRIVCFRPGNNPLQALAAALISLKQPQANQADKLEKIIQLADNLRQFDNTMGDIVEEIVWSDPGTRLLLVVDQFEELYTLCQDKLERQIFLDRLLAATQQINFTLVLTLRADFYGYALSYRPFNDALQGKVFNLGPMNQEELLATVEQPAKLFGVVLESGLSKRMIEVVGTSEGKLPLLEFCLQELWLKQTDTQLTHAVYEQIGGIEKSVASYAEKVYSKLNESDKKRARRIFVELVHTGEGTGDTRYLATRAEVGEDNWDLVTYLAGEQARLVVTGRNSATGEETVEIVHEALIHHWSLLRQWVNESREELAQKRKIETAASEWLRRGKAKGDLLLGKPLKDAEVFLKQQTGNLKLSNLAIEFIRKSNRQRLKNSFKAASWLVLPAVVVLLAFSPQVREANRAKAWEIILSKNQQVGIGKRDALELLTMSCRSTYKNKNELEYRLNLFLFGDCADLRDADLRDADLRDAELSGAFLSGVPTFIRSDVSGANLSGANLSYVKLNSAILTDADLRDTRLFLTDLSYADLNYADLRGAKLGGTDLSNAHLRGAKFRGAKLRGVRFNSANLTDADLSGIDFSCAEFGYGDLEVYCRPDFSGANLEGTNFFDTKNLTPEQVKSARNWEKAKYDKEFRVQLGLPPALQL